MTATAIAVLGAGSWGTALAIQCARAGRETRLFGRDTAQLEQLRAHGENQRYLPGARFPTGLQVVRSLSEALNGARDLLVAVPSSAFRDLLADCRPLLQPGMRVSWATKGFELSTGKLPHQVASEVLGDEWPTAVLSGPTFAKEVGAGLPTAMTVASRQADFAHALALEISSERFRIYTSSDIVGVEVGGAVKNVMAVGAGMSDGLGFGANTRIALITRGLVEMTRLGVALGANRETFMGLAGLGDLVLTCTDNQSRNRRFGLLLAEGHSPTAAMQQIGQAVEGYRAAQAVRGVAQRLDVAMPIAQGIFQALYQNMPPRAVVHGLMTRPIKAESD